MKYVTKTGVEIEAEQFLMHSPPKGCLKYCNHYIVKSPIGLQMIKNFDYILYFPNNVYLTVPKDIFEMLMEKVNG